MLEVISIVSDFFLSAFPVLILRKVQINFRSKVGLCLLMGLGVVTGALSIVRTVLNYQTQSSDATWGVIPNWYWRAWEVFFGIVAACIPTLRPGYKWLRDYVRAKWVNSGNHDSKQVLGAAPTRWLPPKPSAFLRSSKRQTTDLSTKATCEDDAVPLQSLSQSVKAHRGDNEQARYPQDELGNKRKEGLHIPGDLSTHRPGHFKRLDFEAKIGGGFGAEEIDDRI